MDHIVPLVALPYPIYRAEGPELKVPRLCGSILTQAVHDLVITPNSVAYEVVILNDGIRPGSHIILTLASRFNGVAIATDLCEGRFTLRIINFVDTLTELPALRVNFQFWF